LQLIHGDLIAANVLVSNLPGQGVSFLDFDDVAMGIIWMDLACLAVQASLDAASVVGLYSELVKNYVAVALCRNPERETHVWLALLCIYLCVRYLLLRRWENENAITFQYFWDVLELTFKEIG
jgi:Ser/Thr protein kinase RdoA (MazF antagonist)